MKSKIDQFSMDLNPMLNVARDGTVLYSNEASEPLLQEWSAEIGEKLPSSIVDITQSVISRNSPEKIEVKVGNKLYLVVFSPLPGEQYVSISGFDISDQKKSEKGMVSEAREKAERDTPVEELRKSEEKYRSLFDSIDEGFCIIEMIFDAEGKPVDYLFLETNRAFERQTGMHNATGKRMREFVPNHEEHWFEIYGAIAKTGEPRRFTQTAKPLMGGWYDVYAFPYGGSNSNKVAIIFNDITERKRAEKALQESEEKFRVALRSSPTAVFQQDLNLRYTWVYQPHPHFTPEGLLGKRDEDVLDPQDAAPITALKQRALDEQRPLQGDVVIWVNGNPFYYTLSIEPLYDARDMLIGISGASTDITERKRAEKALQESEEKFRVALRSSQTAVFQQDLNLRYTWVYQPHPHFTPEGLLGKRDEDVLDPQDAAPITALKQRALDEQRPLQGDVVIWVNGNPFYYTLSIEPLYDARGMLIGISGASTDITERKRAEKALRESEAKYHGLFDSMAEAFELMELIYKNGKPVDYIFLDVNPAWERMTGLKKEQVLGRKASEAVGSVESYWPEAMDRALKTGEIIQIENYGVVLDKWYNVNMWKFSETTCGVTITDMTESKKAEEALRIANETLEERVQERTSELEQAYKFLKKIETIRKREIHHRVKNNLQVISSLLDLQAEKFDNKECIKDSEVLEAFKESQNRVISMALIHEEFHKGGGIDTLNFSQYIKNLADNLFLTYKFGSDGIILDTDIEENIFFDMDTSIPLGMIINELVSNSLKHAFSSREKGEIKIKLHREERKECIESISEDCKSTNFTLTISDNGVGILEELDIEDLNSLGFQLVISLVDQLDGEFELKRNNGTEFTMRFTVTEKDDPTQVDSKSQKCSN
ncbi:sensory transduction histidine kinase [Methanosarcina barkeri 3]|uniref:Sensory transduction histidine kinase n=1 Tax=Methanosarcina barkeri 3 TaxID=1434107 RepID=A0A0E3SES1_METBA|nr:PAS domain S-box protein [Methanosarcina barkeri]AKB80694.1 sensory transduction histidine kinase [Methanosarcina barkeri 3]